MISRSRLFLTLIVIASLGSAAAHAATASIPGGRYGTVRLGTPPGAMRGFVVLFSGRAGWMPADQLATEQLARDGALVIGVDTARYAENLARLKESCHQLVGDAENMSHQLQREHHSSGYFSPILAGTGQGATLAGHTLAQAPDNTLGGAVAINPEATLDPRFAPCPPDPTITHGPGLPGFYSVAATTPAAVAAARAQHLAGAGALQHIAPGTSADAALVALVRPRLEARPVSESSTAARAEGAGQVDGNLADLALIELPAARPNGMLAIVVSGDGGWRDLDKTIAETLQKAGVSVVGWDSLRYFWNPKTPQQTSRDLAHIMQVYSNRWHARQIALIGYSFGADILPFAYNRLPEAARAQVSAMALLGFAPDADFQIRVTGWLGLPASHEALPVAPEIARVPPTLIECFYGHDEDDSACPSLAGTGATLVRTEGGHHFDHDYGRLALGILSRWKQRIAAQQRNPARPVAPPPHH